jgi:serine/threonine protein kinase
VPLILVENGSQKGRRFELKAPGKYSIGRDKTTEIPILDPMVSRRHCTIEVKEKGYRLRDLGSANGTVVNGERVSERELQPGDRILAGETLLSFLSEESLDPLLGKKLKGYEIVERVGRGGMGTVYRARQVSLDRFVAIKVLSPELVEDPSFVGRFLDEARAAARLSHPNIVMVYDIDDDVLEGQRIVYYSMEFMSGGSVEDLLNREGRLTAERALRICLETAQGLRYAEQVGIVHRDIKPGNLMIHETGLVKIGDLGIATRSRSPGETAVQRTGVSGSPHYISPEQARGQDLDTRADIYSLGASLFQMLTGRPPFNGADVRELLLKQVREPAPDLSTVIPDIHPAVPPIVAKMLEKNRDLRHPNAAQLVTAIEEVLDGMRSPARPDSGRRRILINVGIGAVIAAAVALLGGGIGLLALRYRQYAIDQEKTEKGFRDALEEARIVLAAGRIEEAETAIEKLESDPTLAREYPQIAEEVEALRDAATAARVKRTAGRKEADAAESLAAVRASMPDLSKVAEMKDLESLIPPLEAIGRDHAGTAAAADARKEIDRVRTVMRALEVRFEKARDAYRSFSITAGTYLHSTPPRFREALEKLRSPPPEIRGTPTEKELLDFIKEVTEKMVVETETWTRQAEAESAAGRHAEAADRLERLRDRVEGKAREKIDETIAKIREAALKAAEE